jgi:adenylate kinase
MSRAIIISIHPEHVANILSGAKVFEYRKVLPAREVSHLVLYCTAPVKKVVAVAEISGLLVGSPSKIWAETAYGSGINRKFYRDYFSGRKNASAFKLNNIYKLSDPLDLSKLTSCKVAPQSFCYLNAHDTELILKKAPSNPAISPTLIFIGGIHGVGKTTLCKKVFSPLGFHCMTASSLIEAYGRRTNKNKRVEDVPGNQSVLIEQLNNEKKNHCRLLLDGHFTLLNSNNQIEPIDLSVFQKMKPSLLIFIKGDPKELVKRLAVRDGREWSLTIVKSFQRAEENHALLVSRTLGIPLQIFDNTIAPEKLVKSIRITPTPHSSHPTKP